MIFTSRIEASNWIIKGYYNILYNKRLEMVEQQKVDVAEESTTKSTVEKKETSAGSTTEKEEKEEQNNAAGIEAEELSK